MVHAPHFSSAVLSSPLRTGRTREAPRLSRWLRPQLRWHSTYCLTVREVLVDRDLVGSGARRPCPAADDPLARGTSRNDAFVFELDAVEASTRSSPLTPGAPLGPGRPRGPAGPAGPVESCPALKSSLRSVPFFTWAEATALLASLSAVTASFLSFEVVTAPFLILAVVTLPSGTLSTVAELVPPRAMPSARQATTMAAEGRRSEIRRISSPS
jgi:hypothetical protein